MQPQTQEKRYIYHVYREEIEDERPQVVEAEPERPAPTTPTLALVCLALVAFICLAIPTGATVLSYVSWSAYDSTLPQTVILTLSVHPAAGQLRLYTLPQISETQRVTVAATGSQHQNATRATGLITFYNGLFTTQTISANTTLKGKDGVSVTTLETAQIPPATPTTPPTYGTVSVTASSVVAGSSGNIAASDIDQACCAPSVLAQNLYAFSGGQDEREVTVLTQDDITKGKQQLNDAVHTAVNNQAMREEKPGDILLPLLCANTLTANHRPGDQASTAILTLVAVCTPFVYFAPDIATQARQHLIIPKGYQLVSFSAFVTGSHVSATGGTLTVQSIAYLKRVAPTVSPYRFYGK